MGTRSVIGTIDEQGNYKGRYVHWDGYPTHMGHALATILARFDGGLEQMLRVLTEDHYGWSLINPDVDPADDGGLGGDRANVVPGVGVAYSHTEQPDEWITGKLGGGDPGWDVEWGYFFHGTDPASAVLEVVKMRWSDPSVLVEMIPVTDLQGSTPDSWGKIETLGYSLD